MSLKPLQIPRDYISDLEAQVERLTRENQELRAGNQLDSVDGEVASPAVQDLRGLPAAVPPVPGEEQGHLHDLVKSVRNVVVEPSGQLRFLGASSGITLAKLVMASIRTGALPSSPLSSKRQSQNVHNSTATSVPAAAESSLPPRHAADRLVEAYFQYRTPHMPIMERSEVENSLNNAYSSMERRQPLDLAVEMDIFKTYMILAISLCTVPNPSGGTGRVMQSEGCFRSAIGYIEKVVAYSKSDLETLRAVLLLAQFVSMCPWQGSLWHLSGIALRLCIDMGLHWENEPESLNMEPNLTVPTPPLMVLRLLF